ncbi:protein chain release factor A [Vibrio sp. 16]|nr:protein chain release factor A [Vibrio sp. 16]
MKGVLSLHNDCEVSIEGAVLRFDNDEVIVQLKKGPSFKNMVEEQRHIKNVFPRHFERLKMQAA